MNQELVTIEPLMRNRLHITGAVQGVGFRPFAYRLATELDLKGVVWNNGIGVIVEIEGSIDILQLFVARLRSELPGIAHINSISIENLPLKGYEKFSIISSETTGIKSALILPDIATCSDCQKEIFDPADRRYLYPFTNCTNCGPRYTIITGLPYDRSNTSMHKFSMCKQCLEEYENPINRRFHAQPNACPLCGPQVKLWDSAGNTLAEHQDAILEACQAIRSGLIVAVKGIGGFHLIVDSRSTEAVNRLRNRKHREEKPLAVMYPSLVAISDDCEVSREEKELITSHQAPIVLLKRKNSVYISKSVAPNNPYIGVFLPYSPLHHILLNELNFPVVATSGNLSDEPICTDEYEALSRLNGIADMFLVNNRPIIHPVDDSVTRIVDGKPMILRRARGFAPFPVQLQSEIQPTLAVGGHLKVAFGLGVGKQAFISPHIGDLDNTEAWRSYNDSLNSLQAMFEFRPEGYVCDKHPDYRSSQLIRDKQATLRVQHHVAHILSCMAEHHIDEPVLGIAWDGTGYGDDGTVWGGEFLVVDPVQDHLYRRVGNLSPFPLPGGDKASREPLRSALGLLYEVYGSEDFDAIVTELFPTFASSSVLLFKKMLENKINCPRTSSMGRLFDGVAAIIGLRTACSFEGQAAMELEFLTDNCSFSMSESTYKFDPQDVRNREAVICDWRQLIRDIVRDIRQKIDPALISRSFHFSLIDLISDIVKFTKIKNVVLSGGCFQNKFLLENTINKLRSMNFQPYWNQLIPINDGGISLGQLEFHRLVSRKSKV